MPELPRIIKHGIRPEEKPVYFICYQCGCEFSMARKWCEEVEGFTSKGESSRYWAYPCPECETKTRGDDYLTYWEKHCALNSLNAYKGDDT